MKTYTFKITAQPCVPASFVETATGYHWTEERPPVEIDFVAEEIDRNGIETEFLITRADGKRGEWIASIHNDIVNECESGRLSFSISKPSRRKMREAFLSEVRHLAA